MSRGDLFICRIRFGFRKLRKNAVAHQLHRPRVFCDRKRRFTGHSMDLAQAIVTETVIRVIGYELLVSRRRCIVLAGKIQSPGDIVMVEWRHWVEFDAATREIKTLCETALCKEDDRMPNVRARIAGI
jgi:hypothetical protein